MGQEEKRAGWMWQSERRMSRILCLVCFAASRRERATVTVPYFFPPLFPILPATTEPQKNMKPDQPNPTQKRNTT